MKFVAFMSYAHADEKHTRGRINDIREWLEGEVRLRTGLTSNEFQIFWDKDDIEWGQSWRQRIDQTLDGTTLLIPVLSPTFLKRPECRREVTLFLERESKLGRDDLVLPIFYAGFDYGNAPTDGEEHQVYEAIMAHQFIDWREYRHEPFSNPSARQTLEKMAHGICLALHRDENDPMDQTRTTVKADTAEAPSSLDMEARREEAENETSETPTAKQVDATSKTEPDTLIVDALHRGDHATISEAIAVAAPGTQILVRPGLYEEGLVIDKPLTVVGDGPCEEITVSAVGEYAVNFKTPMGRISNLTIRQNGGGSENWSAVHIGQGRLHLEDCDITSLNGSCVTVRSGAEPIVRRNRIHDGLHAGILVYESGRGVFENNEIYGNAMAGVSVSSGGNPVFRWNNIRDGKVSGINVRSNSQGLFEENQIFGNANNGIQVCEDSNPVFRRNKIYNNATQAIFVHDKGRGEFIENDLAGNKAGAWHIEDECLENVTQTGNKE